MLSNKYNLNFQTAYALNNSYQTNLGPDYLFVLLHAMETI